MNADQLLWLLALILFIVAAVGTHLNRPTMIAFGWVGLAVAALTFVV